jgi:hypothetical protein
MVLQHPHPKLERSNQLDWERLRLDTRGVPGGIPISEMIVRHFDAVVDGFVGKPNVSVLGLLLEVCVWDAFARQGVDVIAWDADLSPNRKNADADLLVRAPGDPDHDYAVLIKTSLRERWKQVDRDAMLMERAYRPPDGAPRSLKVRALFLREKPTDSAQTAIRKAQSVQAKLGAPNTDIRTVMDREGMERLIQELTD